MGRDPRGHRDGTLISGRRAASGKVSIRARDRWPRRSGDSPGPASSHRFHFDRWGVAQGRPLRPAVEGDPYD